MVKIVKGTETNKWLPPEWRKCAVPILRQPAKSFDDITGSAFLLEYKKKPYLVTAEHVTKMKNLVIAFPKKDRHVVGLNSSDFQQAGLKWIKHPAGLDLAAIPFHLPFSPIKELDLWLPTENKWTPLSKFKVGDTVAHLGYPEKGTSNYTDKSRSTFPQAMPGKIIRLNQQPYIIMETAGAHGASGGPVFLKRENKSSCLIGIVITATKYGKHTCPNEGKYLNETKALVISLIKDVLETEEMQRQSSNISKNFHPEA